MGAGANVEQLLFVDPRPLLYFVFFKPCFNAHLINPVPPTYHFMFVDIFHICFLLIVGSMYPLIDADATKTFVLSESFYCSYGELDLLLIIIVRDVPLYRLCSLIVERGGQTYV